MLFLHFLHFFVNSLSLFHQPKMCWGKAKPNDALGYQYDGNEEGVVVDRRYDTGGEPTPTCFERLSTVAGCITRGVKSVGRCISGGFSRCGAIWKNDWRKPATWIWVVVSLACLGLGVYMVAGVSKHYETVGNETILISGWRFCRTSRQYCADACDAGPGPHTCFLWCPVESKNISATDPGASALCTDFLQDQTYCSVLFGCDACLNTIETKQEKACDLETERDEVHRKMQGFKTTGILVTVFSGVSLIGAVIVWGAALLFDEF